MDFKRMIRKIVIRLILFIRRDLDIPNQKMIFAETTSKSLKEMDQDLLGELIRFHGHSLDKAIKCDNKSEGHGRERKRVLENALNEWRRRKYPFGPDKIWASTRLKEYDTWCGGEKKLVQEARESHVTQSNDIFSVIKERRSVRFWKKRAVEREKISQMIEAATYAPTSCNRMPWRFFVLENNIDNVVEGNATNQSMLEKAPLRIYLGIDERLYPEIYAPGIDAGCALQNITLSAHALGLGSCLMYQCESIDQKALRAQIGAPRHYRIYCVVLLGYPNEAPSMPGRVLVGEVCNFTKDVV